MRTFGLILAVSLLVVIPALGAVTNIDLCAANNSGVTGMATALYGSFGGVTPHTHLEMNARMSQMPAANMVYQAWLIDNDTNTRMSLGLLEGNMLHSDMLIGSFGANSPWDAVAISSEPQNDMNPAPNMIVATGDLPGTMLTAANFPSSAVLPAFEPLQRDLAMQQFNLTASQVNNLRMQGIPYTQINLVANIAQRCNQDVMTVATNFMRSGGDLNQMASACNTTVASLLTPAPSVAVAGAIQETRPGYPGAGTMMTGPTFYRTYANGAPVLTYAQWQAYERRGFDWYDVAIAANISAMTGDNMDDLLRMARVQGQLWSDIARERGLDPDAVLNVSAWQWERGSEAPRGVIDTGVTVMTTPGTTGAGTTTQPGSAY